MFGLNRLSVKSKLQIMLSIASLGSILTIGYLCWYKTREILTERISAQLTSVRTSKAYEIESYFQNLRHQIATLRENRSVVTAMLEFQTAFDQLKEEKIPITWDQKISTYYHREFLPRLAKNTDKKPIFDTYRPTSPESRYLQYHYIANNPQPVGKKDELNQARDNSLYSQIHARYQGFFRNLIDRFGYYDLFLIDAETGNIVYSAYKETDFASNLYTGPYRNSNLADVVRQVRDNPDRGAISLVDFQFYRPSYNAPAAFIASPIYEGSRRIGILAIQLPVNEIDKVLTGERHWKQDGLGNTGETYIVGADYRLRSLSRQLIENPQEYQRILRDLGIKAGTLEIIDRLKTSILLHPIETQATKEALRGKSATRIITSYRDSPALSSYAPLNIADVNWGIVAEMALSEAYAPINELQNYLLLSTAILMLLVTLYAAIAAQRFLQPIERMIQHSQPILTGEEAPTLLSESKEKTRDELDELKRSFNGMIGQIIDKTALLKQKEQENESLLLNILPHSVMERWKKGEKRIIEQSAQVTVIVIRIIGLEKARQPPEIEKLVDGYSELVTTFEERGIEHNVERLNGFGEYYVAVCGLTKSRLDHCQRSIDFALDSLNAVKTINQKHSLSLTIKIGIQTGFVTAAIIGGQQFCYDLWGEPLRTAHQLQQFAEVNTILVTAEVRERVADLFPFEKGKTITLEDRSSITSWMLGKSGLQNLINELTFGLEFDEDY